MSATIHTTVWAGAEDLYVRFPQTSVAGQYASVEIGSVQIYLTREAVQELVAALSGGAS